MTAPLIKKQLPNEMICDPFGPMKLIYTLKNPLLLPSLKIKVVSIFIFFSKSQDIFCPIRLFNINSFNTEKIGSSLERNLYDFNCSFSSKTSACSRVRKKNFFFWRWVEISRVRRVVSLCVRSLCDIFVVIGGCGFANSQERRSLKGLEVAFSRWCADGVRARTTQMRSWRIAPPVTGDR